MPNNVAQKINERSWWQTKFEIEAKEYDHKAVNTNAPDYTVKRTTKDLYEIIKNSEVEIEKHLKSLV